LKTKLQIESAQKIVSGLSSSAIRNVRLLVSRSNWMVVYDMSVIDSLIHIPILTTLLASYSSNSEDIP
jgi:hypothetical protein